MRILGGRGSRLGLFLFEARHYQAAEDFPVFSPIEGCALSLFLATWGSCVACTRGDP
jgi:hypothetical protein